MTLLPYSKNDLIKLLWKSTSNSPYLGNHTVTNYVCSLIGVGLFYIFLWYKNDGVLQYNQWFFDRFWNYLNIKEC